MSRTDFQLEILAIAHRVLGELESGRHVDPMRLDWARSIVSANVVETAAERHSAPARATASEGI